MCAKPGPQPRADAAADFGERGAFECRADEPVPEPHIRPGDNQHADPGAFKAPEAVPGEATRIVFIKGTVTGGEELAPLEGLPYVVEAACVGSGELTWTVLVNGEVRSGATATSCGPEPQVLVDSTLGQLKATDKVSIEPGTLSTAFDAYILVRPDTGE